MRNHRLPACGSFRHRASLNAGDRCRLSSHTSVSMKPFFVFDRSSTQCPRQRSANSARREMSRQVQFHESQSKPHWNHAARRFVLALSEIFVNKSIKRSRSTFAMRCFNRYGFAPYFPLVRTLEVRWQLSPLSP